MNVMFEVIKLFQPKCSILSKISRKGYFTVNATEYLNFSKTTKFPTEPKLLRGNFFVPESSLLILDNIFFRFRLWKSMKYTNTFFLVGPFNGGGFSWSVPPSRNGRTAAVLLKASAAAGRSLATLIIEFPGFSAHFLSFQMTCFLTLKKFNLGIILFLISLERICQPPCIQHHVSH